MLTCHPQVTREGHLEPAAERGAVDGRDGRHGQVLERAQRAPEVDEELVHLRLRHRRALAEVRPSAERARRRGADDEHACAVSVGTAVGVE